ncbi:hypothetical protein ZWY2020_031665 [Hordeum vulgare]|nr:hypothetical protein ZWY2020_031665 [Hordeum vulgare]
MPPPSCSCSCSRASFLRLPAPGAHLLAKACGDLSITYRSGWRRAPARPTCGSPSFELKCNSTHAFLSRSILQAVPGGPGLRRQLLLRRRQPQPPPQRRLPPRWFNISLGLGLGPYTISKKNMEVLVLYNCTDQQQAPPPGFSRTRCADGSFYRRRGVWRPQRAGDRPPACSGLAVVPVLGFRTARITSEHEAGVPAQWTVPSDDCPKCEASGGQCRYANDGTGFSCSCSGGVYPDKCDQVLDRIPLNISSDAIAD